ncbi:thioredoxin-like protein [Mycena capillaripes]|nr:thioredoxin-like protein [Mycena capillaripes]
MLLQYLLLVLPSLLSFYFPLTSATPPLKPTSLNPLLTQKDFKSTTTQGVWFVEYFSPYCGHCRHFAPTWAKLVVHSKIPAGVQFAQVDCSVDGALCEANNVIGYPQLNLYRDGEFVDKFKGSRDLDLLIEYLAKSTVPPTGQPSKPVLKPVLKPSEEVVAIAHGFIEPTLTQEDFKATTAKGVWFVQYYTPWCGHCRRFSSTWTKLVLLSRKSTGSVQLAKVDCSASADLCKDVMGYPQMNLYRDGEFVETYDGSRRFDVLTEYFAEVDGTHTPAAMELTPETHHTAMAAPLLVLAAVGTAMKESIADRLSEIALEWRARSHGSDGDAVQFLWVSPEMEDRMTSFIVGDVDVRVMVVDHRMNRVRRALTPLILLSLCRRNPTTSTRHPVSGFS